MVETYDRQIPILLQIGF